MSERMMEVEYKLLQLRKLYVDRIAARFADIEEQWLAMSQGIDREQRETLIRKVHSFSGSGAMYGFTAISEAARDFEKKLVEICKSEGLPTSEQSTEGRSCLEALGEAMRASIMEVQGGMHDG